tara:strand:+ start:2070 stop:2969 length:900 start_codon:yes stop_codon:yes gene_type:complete
MIHPQLCLGTAQFGINYGITNSKGKLKEFDAHKILDLFISKSHKFIDTASAYGNAESVLGKYNSINSFKLISKITYIEEWNYLKDPFDFWDKLFFQTLNNLRIKSIYSYLIHNPVEAFQNSGDLFLSWMESLVDRKLVKRIGASIYDIEEINQIPIEKFSVIQIPLSIYDQRLLKNGGIKKLQEKKIKIHIRSIFLQGLILLDPQKWPFRINPEFRKHHSNFYLYLKDRNTSLLESSLEFAYRIKDIEAITFGITELDELEQILKIWERLKLYESKLDFKDWDWNNKNDIDPRCWKKLT